MRVFFINDSSSNPNWGDRAAATALREMLVQCGHELVGSLTEDELRDLSFWRLSDPIPAKSSQRGAKYWAGLLVPPVFFKLAARLKAQHGLPNEDLVPSQLSEFDDCLRRVVVHREQHEHLLSQLERTDVVVIHGDGCMVGNGIMPRTVLFLAYLIRTRLGKPVALVNHTADFDHPVLKEMALAVYPSLDAVRFRDPISLERCSSFCRGDYAPDSAFYFEPAAKEDWLKLAARPGYFDVWPDAARFDPRKPYVCLGGSSIYSFSLEGKPTHLIDTFITLARHLVSVYQGQLVLTASDIKDEIIFREVSRALNLPLLALRTPVQQAVDVVGNSDAYIGGRWHPSIFALAGGAPIVPFSSKTFKIEALATMAGLGTLTFDAHKLEANVEAIADTLKGYLAQGAQLRERLRSWSGTQRTDCWDNLAFLKSGLSVPRKTETWSG